MTPAPVRKIPVSTNENVFLRALMGWGGREGGRERERRREEEREKRESEIGER